MADHYALRLHEEAVSPPLHKAYALTAWVDRLPVPDHVVVAEEDALWQGIPQGAYHQAHYQLEYDRLLPLVRSALPPAEFDATWATGQQMTLDQAIASAMAM